MIWFNYKAISTATNISFQRQMFYKKHKIFEERLDYSDQSIINVSVFVFFYNAQISFPWCNIANRSKELIGNFFFFLVF